MKFPMEIIRSLHLAVTVKRLAAEGVVLEDVCSCMSVW